MSTTALDIHDAQTLAGLLATVTAGWTAEEQEDGGLVRDHLSDHVSRAELATITDAEWGAAWALACP